MAKTSRGKFISKYPEVYDLGFGFVLFKDANTLQRVLKGNKEHSILGKIVSFKFDQISKSIFRLSADQLYYEKS